MQRLAMALLGLAFATGAQAQSLKEKYELSAQCGKQAAEAFKKEIELPGCELRRSL